MHETTSVQTDRAGGVLLGQAIGDALGVPYEFAARIRPGEARMVGGGLGPYAPGEWSDDTQMALCIAHATASGLDVTEAEGLDAVAQAFLNWQSGGASDIGTRDQHFAVAYAFCSIPTDRSEAERLLAQLSIQDGPRRSLILANQATCALLDGGLPRASDLARTLADGDAVDEVVWLWDPREAVQGRSVVRMMTVAEWLSDLQGGPLNRRRP
ncbi:MAG: ADP-ribosylglycohydrolase family protein [Acidobacteriota bacterium]|nr:ADP-ribosylglycohydrolase family protein [Acidobacteriota bacterium]NLH71193.1 ADP-ribosylglycohydrolase family protein [Brooklawnia sp.]